MAAPTIFASAVSNPGGTGSTLTVTLSTHAVDDILLIYIANTGNALWAGNPAGWSRLDQRTVGTSSNGIVGSWFYHKVVSGDSVPLTNPVFTLGATSTRAAICRTIRGADLEGPFVQPIYGARGFSTGTSNPVRPPAVTTPAPDCLILHCYGQRAATNAPDPTNYTQDQEIIISGTLVLNASQRTVADQQTALSNQDASPTSGARWAAGILCIPSPDYPYFRSSAQATATATNVTPALPAGTTATNVRGHKDLIIATVEAAGTAPSPNTPADWTEITAFSTTTFGGATTVRKYWALYDGSLDRQFNRTGSGEISATLCVFYNAHQTTPIGNTDADQRASSTTSTWDAVTRSNSKCVMHATCIADATPTYTAPSGWTERTDGLGISTCDQIFNATGSTASASFTLNSASPTLVGLVEIIGVSSAGTHELVIQNTSHAHAAENAVLTQAHSLAVQNASHSHGAENLVLTQVHSLIVQDGTHAHSAENAALTQVHELVIQDASHAHTAENLTITEDAEPAGFSAPFPFVFGRMGSGAAETDLVIQDASHAHTAESPSLSQIHELVVASGTHEHAANNVSLAQTHELVTANSSHAHSAGSLALTQAHSLTVENTVHDHTAGNVTLEQAHALSVQNASHEHSAESLTFTQVHGLTVQNASHSHSAESLTLSQVHSLTVEDAAHSHTSENLALGQVHALSTQNGEHAHIAENLTLASVGDLMVQNAVHGHSADSLTFTQVHSLAVQDGAHGHISQNISLTQSHSVVVADGAHTHSGENLTLELTHVLAIQSAIHAQVSESLALTQAHSLEVSSSVHAQTSESPALTQAHSIVIADAIHEHAATNVTLTEVYNLSIQSAVHLHSAENLTLTQAQSLVVSGSIHGHVAQDVLLSQNHFLAVANALHVHTARNIRFGPPRDVSVVLAESRGLKVGSDDRGVLVSSEDRTFRV